MPTTRSHGTLRRTIALGAGLALAAGVSLTGCGSSSSSSASPSTAASGIVVSDARVNEPSVPEKTGAFATIANTTSGDVRLTGASVPPDVATAAELHETVMSGGAMEMKPVASVTIPAGGSLQLKSGGYHIMLMEPHVTVGQSVALTLTFSNGDAVTTQAPVMAPQPMPSSS